MYFPRLKELRKSQKLSQEKLAKKIYLSQNSYSRYESGTTLIPIDSLIRLSDFYGVSIDYIVGRAN